MRMLGNPTDGSKFTKLVIPSGREFPQNPVLGELFHLEVDMPEPTHNEPWYGAGMYVYSGLPWTRLSDSGRQRKAVVIGAQNLEIEVPLNVASAPTFAQGFQIASVTLTPSNRKATFSGSATLWVDASLDCHVFVSIFRARKLVGLTAERLTANTARSLSVSFLDMPMTREDQTYMVRVHTDKVGFLNVNQCKNFGFDGSAQTAFEVAENI